jgi:hypothetical protein
MDRDIVETVWNALHDRFGDDLRVVTRYDGLEYESIMRDDVRDLYPDEQERDYISNTIISQLHLEDADEAAESGPAEGFVRIFGHAWVLTCPDSLDRKSGFIVSLQRDGDLSMDAVEECLTYFESDFPEQDG